MNIEDLDKKDNYFRDELSPFLEFKEEVEKVPIDINKKIIWTTSYDISEDLIKKYDINKYLIEKYGWDLGKTNEQRIISYIYYSQNPNIKNYTKQIKLPINLGGEIDFYYKDNIVKVKYVKEITFIHILQGILLSFDVGSFQLWNYYDSLSYKFTFNIKDKFEFLNIICDIMKLKMENLEILYDLETTGLNTYTDKIVQIYAEETLYGSVICNELVNPEMKIPEVVINIHHIDNEKVKDKPTIEEVKKKMDHKLRNVNKKQIWAHNGNRFDHKISSRYKLFGDNVLEFDSMIAIKNIIQDHTRSFALQNLYKEFIGNENIVAHDAKNDVYMMKQLLKKFKLIF